MKKLLTLLAIPALAACAAEETGGGEEGAQEGGGRPPMPQPVTMAQRPDATGGEALYVEHCAMCHAPNGMGAGLIGRRSDQPLLELREDLTADFVILAARQGMGNMPSIPRGEVTDEEMQSIADYLAAGPHGDSE